MKKKIFFLLLLGIVFFGGYSVYLHLDPVLKITDSNGENTNNKINRNTLRYLENIPVVYLEESGYNTGLNHGKLLKDQVQEVVRILKDDILQVRTFSGFFIQTYLLQKAKAFDAYIPQIYREEMKGIAEGAGVSYNDILLINTYDDLLNLLGCSSVSITKNDSNALFFHARNLDYGIDVLAGKNVVFHYLDKEFISVGFPGYIGALSSTNYSGISLSSHTASVQKNNLGMPTGILYRKIMEEAHSIADVESLLSNTSRTIGNNLVISSLVENQALTFEITADTFVMLPKKGYAIATNHFVSPEFSSFSAISTSSQKRYMYLENFSRTMKNIDLKKIEDTMSFYDGNKNAWSSVANNGTVQSVIFLPEQKKIYITKGTYPPVNRDGYIEYDYAQMMEQEKE
jgi:predicted choloylglycine hydrolase